RGSEDLTWGCGVGGLNRSAPQLFSQITAVGSLQKAVGSGQLTVGSRQWAVGSGVWVGVRVWGQFISICLHLFPFVSLSCPSRTHETVRP
ncbi:MAG: hypothetical protein D6765_16695, partial [Bacteroidetes bacterium]